MIVVFGLPNGRYLKIWHNPLLNNQSYYNHFKIRSDDINFDVGLFIADYNIKGQHSKRSIIKHPD